jgi:hypothetical protein
LEEGHLVVSLGMGALEPGADPRAGFSYDPKEDVLGYR